MTSETLPPDNRQALRRVVRSCRKAALSTHMEDGGAPYVSLVTVAVDHDLAPILLLSGLADHTRNLLADGACALLFDGTEGHANPQTGPRASLLGRAAKSDDAALKARFLAMHPAAAMYADFADFAIWRVAPERVHFVGGFARAVWFDQPFGQDPAAVAAMRAAEPGILAHMNQDHAPSVRHYAETLLGQPPGPWQMVGMDLDGLDLANGENFARLAFPRALSHPDQARPVLVDLARATRL